MYNYIHNRGAKDIRHLRVSEQEKSSRAFANSLMGRNLSNHSESPVGDHGSPHRRSPSRKSPSRTERSPTQHRRPHRGSSPPREKHSCCPKSPKYARSPSPPARSPSPRTKRLRRAQAGRGAVKEPERSKGRGTDRGLQKEGVSERDVRSDTKEKRLGRDDVDGKSSRPRHGTSPSDRQRRSRHISPPPLPAGVTRDVEKVIENDSEGNHGRGSDRRMQREQGSDRKTDSERVERRSGKDSTDHRSSRTRHGRSTSPLDRNHKNRQGSLSPQQAANTRACDEVPNSREDEHRDVENDAVAMMKAAEQALEARQKEKPSFELSGKLAAETNRVRGITLLFTHPPDGRKPDVRWRLYVFKGGEVLNEPLYIHRQSCYLFGRERRVADVPTDHPSCSKQHAVIQFRQVEMEQPDGTLSKKVRPYLMDLGSTNKTFLNDTAIEPQRYYELMEKDTIRFGNSSREYVLLHENSMN